MAKSMLPWRLRLLNRTEEYSSREIKGQRKNMDVSNPFVAREVGTL